MNQVRLVTDDSFLGDLLEKALEAEGIDTIHLKLEVVNAVDEKDLSFEVTLLVTFHQPVRPVYGKIADLTFRPIIVVENEKVPMIRPGDLLLPKPHLFKDVLDGVLKFTSRKGQRVISSVIMYNDLKLDTASREVWRGHRAISLSTKEFDLLSLLMQNPERVLTRDIIFDRVWGYDFGSESNTIEVYINYLRKKLGLPQLIQTVRGVGYVLREE